PMAVARRLHPDQRRRRYLPIEPFRISRGLHQLLLPSFSCLRIQPTHLLPAGMKITSYNHHLRLLPPQRLWSFHPKTNSGSLEPSLLSNQSLIPKEPESPFYLWTSSHIASIADRRKFLALLHFLHACVD